MLKIAALAFAAVLAGYGFHALSQPRIDVRPAVMPIGSSSSNGVSFAWFYDPAERTVFVCRTGGGSIDSVECKGRSNLP